MIGRPSTPSGLPPRPSARLVPWLVWAIAATAGQAEIELFPATRDGQPLALIVDHDSGHTLVSDGDRPDISLELPADVWVSRIAALGDGWIAGGTRGLAGGQDLFLVASRRGVVETLTVPVRDRAGQRLGAVPLVEHGTIAGVAWLEGADLGSLAVRAAAAEGAGWGAPETVSPSGPGSQVALSGAVLSDGRWLLVWTGFDGGDDEVLWSLRATDGRWSAPTRLHADNDTFDITPALVATESGAVAAWSRLTDGHYRLRIAGFVDDAWTEAGWVGPPGSLYPTLTASRGGARLLYETVVPATWTLLETDTRGRPLRRSQLPVALGVRPLLDASGAETLVRWPAPDGTARAEETVRWTPVE